MTLQLIGTTTSTCSLRVLLTCKELGIDIEVLPITLPKGEHKKPDHLAKHPFGQIPVLIDGDFMMYESRAICRYIAAKYGKGQLVPSQSGSGDYYQQTARFEQAASIEYSDFDPLASGIIQELVFKKMKGLGEPDQAKVKQMVDTLSPKLDAYEAILSKQKYLAGDEYTLADLFHLPYGAKLHNVGFEDLFSSRPNVARWWADISSRKASSELLPKKA